MSVVHFGDQIMLQSISFEACDRCMGHGVFATVPASDTPMVAFSQLDALEYLRDLLQDGRISWEQTLAVEQQIRGSHLPWDVPQEVFDVVVSCLWVDQEPEALVQMAAEPGTSHVSLGMDIAQVVHVFLLFSSKRPELRLQ